MSSNLMAASHEFFTRAADEEFPTLDALIHEGQRRREFSQVVTSTLRDASFNIGSDGNFTLNGAGITPWAFTQFAARLAFPAEFVRRLSSDTIVRVVREQQRKMEAEEARLLVTEPKHGGRPEVRAILTPRYERVWDADLFLRVQRSVGDVLKPAGDIAGGASASGGRNRGMSATQGRAAGLKQRSGLYSSDRNTFAFLVNPKPLPGPDGGDQLLYRGCIIRNSETGERKYGAQFFAFDSLCANHIIWGAEHHRTIERRHIGKKSVANGLRDISHILEHWCALTPEIEIERLILAKKTTFYSTPEEREKKLRARGFPVHIIDASETHASNRALEHGTDPTTVWGVVSGLTRAAQDLPFAGDRVDVEVAAGELLAELPV